MADDVLPVAGFAKGPDTQREAKSFSQSEICHCIIWLFALSCAPWVRRRGRRSRKIRSIIWVFGLAFDVAMWCLFAAMMVFSRVQARVQAWRWSS